MQPATLVEDSPNDHHQSIAARIHRSPLLQGKKVRPNMDCRCCPVDNLQKRRFDISIKYNTITAIPNCPNQSTNFYSDSCFSFLIDPIKPIPEQIIDTSGRGYVIGKMQYSPN
jgi:hypothetical protein